VDRHSLYELCVQDPPALVPFLRALHGGSPRLLREDFAGTAAISREWVRAVPGGRAIAVDQDGEALSRCPPTPDLRTCVADALEGPAEPCDVIHCGNFSIGYLATRGSLLAYLGRTRERLQPEGVFVCDTFGGATAFQIGALVREKFLPDGTRVRSTWERLDADPLLGTVVQALHFRADRSGEVVFEEREAFVYRWRLWSVPELRDALAEVGFARIQVHDRLELSSPSGARRPAPAQTRLAQPHLADDYAVCLASRRD
jgi:hypothetical protein